MHPRRGIDPRRLLRQPACMSKAGPWSIFGAVFCLGVLAKLPAIYAALPFWGTCGIIVLAIAAWIPVCATVLDPALRGWLEHKLDIRIVSATSKTADGGYITYWVAESGTRRARLLFDWMIFPVAMLLLTVPILGLLIKLLLLAEAMPK